MKSEVLKQFRHQLEALFQRVGADVAAVREQLRGSSGGQMAGELSNAPFHLGDMGTEEFLYDMNSTVLENEEFLATEIAAALGRISAGTYGECERCGKRILQARLKAIPYARFCVKCAEAIQAGAKVNLNEGRPRTPQDTLAPEGEMHEERRPSEKVPYHSRRTSMPSPLHESDIHAAGTPGGGTSLGGLAGSNEGRGEPDVIELNEAAGSSNFDSAETIEESANEEPRSGQSGGAVGGTPARKRAK